MEGEGGREEGREVWLAEIDLPRVHERYAEVLCGKGEYGEAVREWVEVRREGGREGGIMSTFLLPNSLLSFPPHTCTYNLFLPPSLLPSPG